MFGVNPDAGILNGKDTVFTVIMPAHGNGSTFRGVLNGIGNQVAKGTGQLGLGTDQVTMTVNVEIERMVIVDIIGLCVIKQLVHQTWHFNNLVFRDFFVIF